MAISDIVFGGYSNGTLTSGSIKNVVYLGYTAPYPVGVYISGISTGQPSITDLRGYQPHITHHLGYQPHVTDHTGET